MTNGNTAGPSIADLVAANPWDGLERQLNAHDRQPQPARIRGCLERTTDPSQLARSGFRQIDPDLQIVNPHRYGVFRNTLAIEVEAQIHFEQLEDRHAFDADRLAARIGSNPDRRRGLAPAKLSPLIFLEGIEARLIKNGDPAQSGNCIWSPEGSLAQALGADAVQPLISNQLRDIKLKTNAERFARCHHRKSRDPPSARLQTPPPSSCDTPHLM